MSLNLINTEKHKELEAVLQGNGEFSKNLHTILAKKKGNVFFSPISIHAILSLVYQGTRGFTQEAFTKILNMSDVGIAASGYKHVMSRLNSVSDVTILIANKIFLQENYKLQEKFNIVAAQQFLSEVQLLDFTQSQMAASVINSWVENKTNHKIKDLVKPNDISDGKGLVLVNAIYFKGKWAYPFNAQRTRIEMFYLNDVDIVDVQMMHIKKEFFYKEDYNLDAKILELPYINRTFSLIVVLPNKRNGITELEQKLEGTDITKLTDYMDKQEVLLALPKFKIEQTIDLRDSLSELGLDVIFKKEHADFSGIIETTDNLCVSKTIQKVFIEVNEEGTEAAAATYAEIRLVCYRPPVEFTADHPFVVILQATQDEIMNVLFMGRISKPQY